MASKEELFISISPEHYKKNKSEILKSQADLLHVLKHFQNIKVLNRQKNDLKKELHRLTSSVESQIETLQDKLPTPKVPKSVYKSKVPKPEKEEAIFSKKDEIEEELKAIHSKLQELNS